MKQLKYFFFLPVSLVLILFSCKPNNPDPTTYSGNWISISNSFPGDQRNSAVCFTIGDTAYIGTGYNQTRNLRYSDLWSFNPTKGWSQLNNAPAAFTPRSNAVAFAVGTNGYIALGQDNSNNFLKDTWQFSVANNAWTKKSDFGGTARIDAISFSIGNLGYVLCGYDQGSNRKDSWQYNPTTDSWSLTAIQFNGNKRRGAISFVYKSKAYIVTGVDDGGNGLVHDFIVFDPSNTATPWTQKRDISNTSSDSYDDDYTDIIRDHGVGFVLGDSAYIAVGSNGGYNTKTWGYDFVNDLWFRKTTFEKAGRSNSIGFTIAGQSFITTGRSSTQDLDDLNGWFPYQTYNVND